ncbi:MAG: dihydrodipicolinate synthase family protein, partial [Anaerolineae bacterium]|nr:dihydrodipicolinate synthase family protein [Anaerolineae bacterium]
DVLEQIVEFLLSHGVHALFPGGTTGEGMLLSLQERQELAEAVVKYVAGRVPVIVQTGCINTVDAVCLTRHAQEIGATAVAVIVPFFYTLEDTSLLNHFVTVAQATPNFPIFLYTIPGNTKNDLSPLLLKQLRQQVPNIVGLKSSNPDTLRFQDYLDVGGENFTALNGVDGLMGAALNLGAKGQVTGNSNAFPEAFCALYQAHLDGNPAKVKSQQRRINQIRQLVKDGLHPAYYKAVLRLRGIPASYVRSPLRELTAEEFAQLERGCHELGLL